MAKQENASYESEKNSRESLTIQDQIKEIFEEIEAIKKYIGMT